jgi:hypothetical protein
MQVDDTLIKTNQLVVAGFIKGKLNYLGFDSNSGGYPYASSYMQSRTGELSEAVSWLPEATSSYCGIPDPKVYEIVLREVDISKFVDEEKEVEEMFSKLSEAQKKLLKAKLN